MIIFLQDTERMEKVSRRINELETIHTNVKLLSEMIIFLQDTERMEKVSRRINELETIHTNVKLLSEMVEQYNSQTSTSSEKEMMKVTRRFSLI